MIGSPDARVDLVPLNDDYPNFTLPLEHIQVIAPVVGYVKIMVRREVFYHSSDPGLEY